MLWLVVFDSGSVSFGKRKKGDEHSFSELRLWLTNLNYGNKQVDFSHGIFQTVDLALYILLS